MRPTSKSISIIIIHSTFQITIHLQVTIWGDYSRIEGKKVFMGVAQIMLDDLDLSNIVIGWYKLFGTSSLVSVPPNGPPKGSSAGPNPGGQSSQAPPPPPQQQSQPNSANPAIINKGSLHSLDSYG